MCQHIVSRSACPSIGWIVEAAAAEEALDIIAGAVPEADEAGCDELLVWPERFRRARYLLDNPMPAGWSRL